MEAVRQRNVYYESGSSIQPAICEHSTARDNWQMHLLVLRRTPIKLLIGFLHWAAAWKPALVSSTALRLGSQQSAKALLWFLQAELQAHPSFAKRNWRQKRQFFNLFSTVERICWRLLQSGILSKGLWLIKLCYWARGFRLQHKVADA